MKEFKKRWNARMPKFWAKVHKAALIVTGASGAGGLVEWLFNIPDSFLIYPEQVKMIGRSIFSVAILIVFLSKLTKEEKAEPKPEVKS